MKIVGYGIGLILFLLIAIVVYKNVGIIGVIVLGVLCAIQLKMQISSRKSAEKMESNLKKESNDATDEGDLWK